jgi:hypothetical protein
MAQVLNFHFPVKITPLPKLWILEVQKPKQPEEQVFKLEVDPVSKEKVLIATKDLGKGTLFFFSTKLLTNLISSRVLAL